MEKRTVSVLDMGVVAGQGENFLQTVGFQKAIDEMFLAGGGTVIVPKGIYYIGGVRLRSNVTLYLCAGAEIYGSRDPEDYNILAEEILEPVPAEWCTDKLYEPPRRSVERDYSFMLPTGRWNNAMFRAIGAENVAIVGEEGARIDGRDCYDEVGEEKYRGPHGISMHYCKNIYLSGYIASNTGNWAHCIWYSENIRCENVKVYAGHDGIHLTRCSNIAVENCEFYTGDDCVAGFGNLNVLVQDCVLNTACSGLRFGGTNAIIRNCKFYGPAKHFFRGSLTTEEKKNGAQPNAAHHRTNMLSMFTYYADFSVEIPEQPDNIVIENCTVENADRFLHFNYSGNEIWQNNRPLKTLRLENISATGIVNPVTAYGSKDVPFDLRMKNVSLEFAKGFESLPAFWIANCERVCLENMTVKNRSDAPLIKTWTKDPDVVLHNVSHDCHAEQTVVFTEETFVCKAI